MTHRRNQYNAPKGRHHRPKQTGGPMADRRTNRLRTRGDAEREALREYEEDESALDAALEDALADTDLSGPEWDDPEEWPDWDDPEVDFDGCGCDECRGICRDCGLAPCKCDYLDWHEETA